MGQDKTKTQNRKGQARTKRHKRNRGGQVQKGEERIERNKKGQTHKANTTGKGQTSTCEK